MQNKALKNIDSKAILDKVRDQAWLTKKPRRLMFDSLQKPHQIS